jgi:beta-barrel assembly-enhancing protease
LTRTVMFVGFCAVWYLTPFSSYIINAVVYCVPRYLDVQMGIAGAAVQRYVPVSRYDSRVSQIGRNLVGAIAPELKSGYNFEFKVIDKDFVNAFAYPGGKIYITDALIEDLNASDDELAAVIAHEIGHVIHRHSVKRIVESSAVVLMWKAIFYSDDDEHQENFGEAIGELLIRDAALFAGLSFSRAHEFEADDAGWRAMMAVNGYDPKGMISFFEKLLQLTPDNDGTTHWDSTHPGTADRIVALKRTCGDACVNMPAAPRIMKGRHPGL